MVEIESLPDFDEIWYMGVFEGADFKNRIHFFVESFSRFFWGLKWVLGSQKSVHFSLYSCFRVS